MNVGQCTHLTIPRRAKPLPLRTHETANAIHEDALPAGIEYRAGARELLAKWPEICPLLLEARDELKKIFGAEAGLALKPFSDPDSPDAEPSLFLIVRTTRSAETAGLAMDEFEERWWMNNMTRSDHLYVNLEFA